MDMPASKDDPYVLEVLRIIFANPKLHHVVFVRGTKARTWLNLILTDAGFQVIIPENRSAAVEDFREGLLRLGHTNVLLLPMGYLTGWFVSSAECSVCCTALLDSEAEKNQMISRVRMPGEILQPLSYVQFNSTSNSET